MASRPHPAFDPIKLIEVLNRHGVEYVVIGGVGARLQGSPHQTRDLDVAAMQAVANLRRLADALNELAPMRIDPQFRTPAIMT